MDYEIQIEYIEVEKLWMDLKVQRDGIIKVSANSEYEAYYQALANIYTEMLPKGCTARDIKISIINYSFSETI